LANQKFDYDLIVIGSGPAGEKAAINAAKMRKTTAIIERRSVQGGVCIHAFKGPVEKAIFRSLRAKRSNLYARRLSCQQMRSPRRFTPRDDSCSHNFLITEVFQQAFKRGDTSCINSLLPIGIYTIPEVSMVGQTEEALSASGQEYEVGIARYFELARGQIINDHDGMLKLIFEPESRRLLGVHIVGERATELINIGQAVMTGGGTLDYFVDTVFNYPTLSEAYKIAAMDGFSRIFPGGQRK
jgi:pyruvate/2-oxoglutarate dehydrogenase complex dihydrolipoamide dehydrogenase (E3) component